MHRNTIEFDGTNRQITLVAQGTVWPIAIEVDGETWERTQEVTEKKGEAVRVYKRAEKRLRVS